jgi:chorismate mutase
LLAGIDMLWIGARTTVNPFYVQEIAEALKGVDIPVFVKNPIHPEIGLWLGALERLSKAGVNKLAAIHRGFYNYKESAFRNEPKWEMPIKLREEVRDLPIICDPSHIAGKASLIEDVSQTAMDINLDGLMIEVHNNPSSALSDSQQQVTPQYLKAILNSLILRDTKLRDKAFKDELLEFRDQIDLLDHQIIELLNDRKQIVEAIANFKDQNKLTIFQIDRWFEILKNRKLIANNLDLDDQMIAEIFELIHKYSVLTQTKIMR